MSYFKAALILIVFGCVMLYLGMGDSTHYDELKKDCTFSTKATVTRLNEKGEKIAPVFEFEYQGKTTDIQVMFIKIRVLMKSEIP